MLRAALDRGGELDALWAADPLAVRSSPPSTAGSLPELARRYLRRALPDTNGDAPGPSAVRLWMHGEIRLARWFPFRAEQVIRRGRGFHWQATVRTLGLPIRGFDRLVDGEGEMRWKLLGLIPLVTADGPDITRSAAGRLAAESIWLPSVLAADNVGWDAMDGTHVRARLPAVDGPQELELGVDAGGRLRSVRMCRWGDPGGAPFREIDFGALVQNEGSFDGYTIPTDLRVGWFFDGTQFAANGEVFRVRIDRAAFK